MNDVPNDPPLVATRQGAMRGVRLANGVAAFLGVPYGEDTGGANRFRPPRPHDPWTEIRDCTAFGESCTQGTPTLPEDDPASTKGLALPSGEDCLVLNVWTPSLTTGGARPVMVWLHGGGLRVGSGSHPVTDGANLSAHGGVVVVSLNHRLNIFGHLYLGEICGPDFSGSGVSALLDIILALEWVKDHIAAFGGDPGNVTFFGESGGGRKVCCLMAMPAAKGLFHRAIVQSGAHTRGVPAALATRLAVRLFEHLGLRVGDVEALQRIGDDDLFARSEALFDEIDDPLLPSGAAGRWLFSPVVDGAHLPADPWSPASPLSRDIPLLIGSNKDEAALGLATTKDAGAAISDAQLLARLSALVGDRAAGLMAVHQCNRPAETNWDHLVAINSEDRRLLSIEIALQKSRQGAAPAFLYAFTWESNNGFFKAAHTMEIPFVFRNVDSTSITGTRSDRNELADIMSGVWLAFARTGNPNCSLVPPWKPYDEADRATMILDVPARVESDWRREERLAWGALPPLPWEAGSLITPPASDGSLDQPGVASPPERSPAR
jgi:para-nitrobenzyl esterase